MSSLLLVAWQGGSAIEPRKAAAVSREVSGYQHGRVPRGLRRKQVLAEAHDLFVELGYHRASMDELARRVGVSKPVIYDLAGSKEELFRDVMAEMTAELTEHVSAAVAGERDVSRMLHAGNRSPGNT